jgi:hypothetical protein
VVDERGTRTIVTVVEPADSARVVLRPARDSARDKSEWRDGIAIFRAHNHAFQAALTTVERHRAGDGTALRDAARAAGKDSTFVPAMWRFLDAHRTDGDFRDGLRVLALDGNVANQALAAAILGGFMDRDSAWWSLIDAERSSVDAVAITASQVLVSAVTSRPHGVDWAPAVPAIRHLAEGTNVFLLEPTLDVLARTRISPSLAALVLEPSKSDLLLAFVAAHEPTVREAAHAFLVQISGRDYGYDADLWSRWISSLR